MDEAYNNEWLTDKERDFLTPPHPRAAVFYLLPKIHKNPHTPPGRPIISGIGTITEPASKYIDFIIKPLTSSLRSYLHDTTDVLNKLEAIHSVNDTTFLATMDVNSLYTNIDHKEGLEALHHFLQKRADNTAPPTDFVLALTEWTLNSNIFLFQDQHYRQVKGTAMGAAFAPNYAGLFMGLWEERHIFGTNNPFKDCIKWYGRYIDDLLFVFEGQEQQLHDFHTYLNNANEHIKLSLEYSKTKISFLDLNITIDTNGEIHTSIFRKMTDRNTILRADSFHPRALISNIPLGQFQRLKRICDTEEAFNSQALEMYTRFQVRGYDCCTLNKALTKAKETNRKDLLSRTERRHQQLPQTFFSSEYSHLSYKIKNVIKKTGIF